MDIITENRKTKKTIKYYLSQGFSIIPLKGRFYASDEKDSKKPLLSWGKYQTERATLQEALEWLDRWPEMSIGIVTGRISGIVVVDLDSLEAIEMAKKEGLLNTAVVQTGKGLHAYFKYPEGKRIANTVRLSGREIDIRGDGGYVVAPPSIHWSGTEYRWLEGHELWKKPIAELPGNVLEAISLKEDGKNKAGSLKPLYGGVDEGQRNDSLARLVGSWLRDGLTYNECLQMARVWNQNNKPPLEDKEVISVVTSIYKKHIRDSQILENELRYEKNLLYLPLFVYNRNLIHKAQTISHVKEDNGIKRKWEVRSAVGLGLPGPFDEAVFLAVCMIIEKNKLPARNPFSIGSLKDIARMMHIPPEGKNIMLIKQSLIRLVSVTLVSDNTFYHAEKKQTIASAFHLWDRVVFRGEKINDNDIADSILIWMSEVTLSNLRMRYLSTLEYDKYINLNVPIARGIFRIISPRLEKEKEITIKYSTLQQRLQFQRVNYLAKIKEQLEKAHTELKEKKIIKNVEIRQKQEGNKENLDACITYFA